MEIRHRQNFHFWLYKTKYLRTINHKARRHFLCLFASSLCYKTSFSEQCKLRLVKGEKGNVCQCSPKKFTNEILQKGPEFRHISPTFSYLEMCVRKSLPVRKPVKHNLTICPIRHNRMSLSYMLLVIAIYNFQGVCFHLICKLLIFVSF